MGKTVLTIDDSKTVRTVISKHLTPFSVGMLEAENGEEGVVCARNGSPDLILLDYNMPVMDGYHTLVELKTDPNLKSIPVVMVTTETAKETVVKLLKLGLKDYIAKPFTREMLLRKINPILNLYSGDSVPAESELAPKPEAESAAEGSGKPCVLAVDDKANVLELIKEYLDDHYELVTADGGKPALAALMKKNYSCVFLDLSMPDMGGLEVLDQYQQKTKNVEFGKKVIAMTLRSAQQEILKASDYGVQAFLYKPFTRADVAKALEQITKEAEESSPKKLHYLTMKGKTPILDCPAQKSSKYRFIAEFLNTEIIEEIDDVAEGGSESLIIKIGEGFLSSIVMRQKFISLIEHTRELGLTVRLVVESPECREVLRHIGEMGSIPIDVTLECALGSVA